MGRRDGPELAPAKMAHAEATIAGSAEGRSLVIGPVLSRHTIGREALPPIISITVAPCVKTAVHTGATELVLGGWVLLGTADRLVPKWPRINGLRAVLTIAKLIPQFQTYLADN